MEKISDLSSADFIQNELFQKNISVSNSLDPDQARFFVGYVCFQTDIMVITR